MYNYKSQMLPLHEYYSLSPAQGGMYSQFLLKSWSVVVLIDYTDKITVTKGVVLCTCILLNSIHIPHPSLLASELRVHTFYLLIYKNVHLRFWACYSLFFSHRVSPYTQGLADNLSVRTLTLRLITTSQVIVQAKSTTRSFYYKQKKFNLRY